MQGGARYQNQVTAWLAAKMLAERPAAPIIPRGKLTYLAAESGEAVDDVLAGTDQGNFAFVQAKRKISLSAREGSDLEGVVNQSVRQIAAAVEPDKRPWSRALNPNSDRLLLVTSSDSRATIRTRLRNALQRVGGLHPEQTVMDAARNHAGRTTGRSWSVISLDIVPLNQRARIAVDEDAATAVIRDDIVCDRWRGIRDRDAASVQS